MALPVTKASATGSRRRPPPDKARNKASASPARARGGEARRIAELIPAVGDTAFRKFGFVQASIVTRWKEIAGERLAAVTAPESLRFPQGKKTGGTLSIAVSGAHGPIVQHVIPDIIARVNRFFGYAAVARVRVTQGRAMPPTVSTATATLPIAQAAPPATLPLSPGLGAIADPELREVLHALASSLAKRDGLPKIG